MNQTNIFLAQAIETKESSATFHQLSTKCIEQLHATSTLEIISNSTIGEFIILQVKPGKIEFNYPKLQSFINAFENSNSLLSYSNFNEIKTASEAHPVNHYQLGSIRDDFDFGALVIFKKKTLVEYLDANSETYQFSGWYDFRLFCSRKELPQKIAIDYYTFNETDLRLSGQKQFDYVNPANRERQIELEKVATKHLQNINAAVEPPFGSVSLNEQQFEIEASVIIPVLNREKTIADAIASILKQQTNFKFNILAINNHSTDKTSEIIDSFNDERVIQIIPEETNLGIGGCWNKGINDVRCGKFAIQLDSDDLYKDENTLQKIVDQFYAQQCAMVIGSYQMVNFKLEEIPPGIIDHKEWTDNNGPNNALRINGLGAPRAFYTPVVRKIQFPNVSYGEDYAVAIQITREYRIGRIYDPIYLCRRWDDNTDANLSIEKMNAYNAV